MAAKSNHNSIVHARPCRDNSCVVVVTYFPDDLLKDRLSPLAAQFDTVLVIDNSCTTSVTEELSTIVSGIGGTLITNPTNVGVATALNQGLHWAEKHGYAWMLSMDQDSIAYGNMLEVFGQVYDALPDPSRVAVIGSNYVDRYNKNLYFTQPESDGPKYVEVVTVITSGCLTSVPASRTIGPFIDDFFIDHVDDEYCLRSRACGYGVVLTSKPVMEHAIGSPKKCRFLWKRLTTPNSPAFRRYYQARNHLVVIRRYMKTEAEWVKWSIRVRVKEIILMLLLEEGKLDKTWKLIMGFTDAIRGRMGPLGCKHEH